MSIDEIFHEVWHREFLPEIAARRRRENELRTEAFLEVPLTLCGEQVRQMTPADMLHLDALENPFISGAADGLVDVLDCASFLWQLSVHNNQTSSLANLWRRRKCVQRVGARELLPMAREIQAFVDRMLMHEPVHGQEPARASPLAGEPKTYFLAPLLVTLSAHFGHVDPMSGQLLSFTPLPRLMQYLRAVQEENGTKTYTEFESARNRCMDRVNQIVNRNLPWPDYLPEPSRN